MKKKKEKESVRPIALAIILGILFIFSFKIAKAETLYIDQPVASSVTASSSAAVMYQTFRVSTTTSASQAAFRLNINSWNSTNSKIFSRVFQCDVAYTDAVICGSGEVQKGVTHTKYNACAANQLPNSLLNSAVDYVFDYGSISFDATKYYLAQVVAQQDLGCVSNFVSQYNFGSYGTKNENAILNGKALVGSAIDSGVDDLYFKLGNSITHDAINVENYIDFVFPLDGMSVLFNSGFDVAYSLNSSTTADNYVACVNYVQATSTAPLNFNLGNQTCAGIINNTSSSRFSIQKYQNDPIGDYYAQAFMSTTATSGVTQIIASSTVILYSQTSSDPFTATSTTPANDDIDSACAATTFFSTAIVGCIGEMFVWTFHQVFYPHDFSTAALKQTFANFKTIFPFNLFFNFNQLTTDALEANLNQPGTDLTVQVFSGNAATVEILSSTGLEDLVGVASKNLIFTVLINLMWIVVVFKIIRTVT